MIQIFFKEAPKKLDVSVDLSDITRIGNNSFYDPLIKHDGGEEHEYIDQEVHMEFNDGNESNILALIISGKSMEVLKKLIKKSL